MIAETDQPPPTFRRHPHTWETPEIYSSTMSLDAEVKVIALIVLPEHKSHRAEVSEIQ